MLRSQSIRPSCHLPIRRIFALALPLLPVVALHGQTRPIVDHHQHLFGPATVALVAPKPLPKIDLPSDLAALVQALEQAGQDTSALRQTLTDDVSLATPAGFGWVRGRDAVAGFLRSTPFHLTPVGWSASGSAGELNAYLTEGQGDSAQYTGRVLLSLRQVDGRWKVAAVGITPNSISIKPIVGADLVALLDAAGIKRALLLSMGYTWGNPSRNVEDEYQKVKAENDWTSQQVALFPDRLRGFCGLNPLRAYALDELARCAADPRLRLGLKLHFGNSAVDVHDPQHIEQLRKVFRAANGYRMPIVIHLHASISKGFPYGADEGRIFLNELLPAAPDVPVQIAHLAGAGGADDPGADAVLAVLAEAIAKKDPRTARLLFDVSGVVTLDITTEQANLIVRRIRQIGVERILYGSDAATGGNLAPRQAWAAFRQLPLTDAEFAAIANNVAPYMR